MKIRRKWAMSTSDTFDCEPIRKLIGKYLALSTVSVDPFARNKRWATYTNDLNPMTEAEFHLDAVAFLNLIFERDIKVDLLLFDPPYSPRQISECYAAIGLEAGKVDTQNAQLYSACRDAAMKILTEGATVISCGWNSAGMGTGRGFEIQEILLVCHGGAHNDTIVTVERRRPGLPGIF
jgi:hypothetical protein